MKKIIFVLALISILFASCKKDSPRKVEKMLEEGNWKITYFDEKGTIKSETYLGDVFTFKNDQVVNATHSSTSFEGTWECSKSDGNTIFSLDMKNPSEFLNISKDWKVIEKTDVSLKLSFLENDGKMDYLNFDKN
ncbi:MAG: hypothetical protein V4622_02415 [Bacteroidota bacterium]